MGLMGYVVNGKYVKANGDEIAIHVKADSPQFKAGDHERQRKDFAREILQPYDQSGKPNEDYINAYPDIARERGMTPKGEE